jgi:hypothetical protein
LGEYLADGVSKKEKLVLFGRFLAQAIMMPVSS